MDDGLTDCREYRDQWTPRRHRDIDSYGRGDRVARVPAASPRRRRRPLAHHRLALQVAYHAPLMAGADYGLVAGFGTSLVLFAIGDLPISFIMARESTVPAASGRRSSSTAFTTPSRSGCSPDSSPSAKTSHG